MAIAAKAFCFKLSKPFAEANDMGVKDLLDKKNTLP